MTEEERKVAKREALAALVEATEAFVGYVRYNKLHHPFEVRLIEALDHWREVKHAA